MIPGALAWSAAGGKSGVLLLHGLTGTPVSLHPLAEALAGAGFTVELPLLPGHGTCWRDLARTTWQDWELGAARALDRLRSRTSTQVLLGLSMGAALALRLAQTQGSACALDAPDGQPAEALKPAGLVLINPSLSTRSRAARLVPILRHLVPAVSKVGNDIAKPGADERPYDRLPLNAVHSVRRLWSVVRADLATVEAPMLVFTSRQDHVVEPENSALALAGVSSTDREQVWLEHSYHVATLDHDAERIAERTIAFVRRVTAEAPG